MSDEPLQPGEHRPDAGPHAGPHAGPGPDQGPGSGPEASATPDEVLFTRYRDGEAGLLRELIGRHHDELLGFLYRMVGDRQAAEDLFQEAFLQVHLSSRTFDPTRRFRPWLFTIAANKARDHLRRKARRSMQELSAPIGNDGDGASFIDLLSLDLPAPDDRMTRAERDALVQRALGDLSPTLKEALLLAYFQRLSYAQIAEELGIPLGTVKSRLHAAVASFARAWRRHADGVGPERGPGEGGGSRP